MADDLILDDPAAMLTADPGEMLRSVASGGAQIRQGLLELDRDALERLSHDGRPRAVVVCGMGGSGVAGRLLAAVSARVAPVPVVVVADYALPAWVSALDTVISVSCSGGTEETLAATGDALRRGARVVAVGAEHSPLLELAASASSSTLLAVDAGGRMPRASLWSLLVPVLLASERLGLLGGVEPVLQAAADSLDEIAIRCGVEAPLELNEAKALGLALAESLPMVWGTGDLGGVAAYRLACQLNENAQVPVVHGTLPEAHHNQVVVLDRPVSASPADDFFRDRVDDPEDARAIRLVLLRDGDESPAMAARAEATVELAARHQTPVSVVRAEPGHPVLRMAHLVGVSDWASVYAALALGVDPTPIAPIMELKAQLASSADRR